MKPTSRWPRVLAALDAWDRRWQNVPRRLLGVLLILAFLGSLAAMLYGWFRLMQPYAE